MPNPFRFTASGVLASELWVVESCKDIREFESVFTIDAYYGSLNYIFLDSNPALGVVLKNVELRV